MSDNFKFDEQILATLNQYIPIVARVHGPTHSEFYEVQKIYNQLVETLKESNSLESLFGQLREVTSNYLVPVDVCESYEAVYEMLNQLDNAYSNFSKNQF
ncbi:MAG: hypothetical protein WCY53_05025 [Sphaerochaetaceae bacterium]